MLGPKRKRFILHSLLYNVFSLNFDMFITGNQALPGGHMSMLA